MAKPFSFSQTSLNNISFAWMDSFEKPPKTLDAYRMDAHIFSLKWEHKVNAYPWVRLDFCEKSAKPRTSHIALWMRTSHKKWSLIFHGSLYEEKHNVGSITASFSMMQAARLDQYIEKIDEPYAFLYEPRFFDLNETNKHGRSKDWIFQALPLWVWIDEECKFQHCTLYEQRQKHPVASWRCIKTEHIHNPQGIQANLHLQWTQYSLGDEQIPSVPREETLHICLHFFRHKGDVMEEFSLQTPILNEDFVEMTKSHIDSHDSEGMEEASGTADDEPLRTRSTSSLLEFINETESSPSVRIMKNMVQRALIYIMARLMHQRIDQRMDVEVDYESWRKVTCMDAVIPPHDDGQTVRYIVLGKSMHLAGHGLEPRHHYVLHVMRVQHVGYKAWSQHPKNLDDMTKIFMFPSYTVDMGKEPSLEGITYFFKPQKREGFLNFSMLIPRF